MSEQHRTLLRTAAVALLATLVLLAFGNAPATAVTPGVAEAPVSGVLMSSVLAGSGVASSESAQPNDEGFEANRNEGTPSLAPLIGLGVLVAILVFGLKAIKRQRDEGRRSKLPPIG